MDGVLIFDVGSQSLTVLLAAPGVVWETSVVTRLAMGGAITPGGADVLIREARRILEEARRRVSSGLHIRAVGVGTGILRATLPELVDRPLSRDLVDQVRRSALRRNEEVHGESRRETAFAGTEDATGSAAGTEYGNSRYDADSTDTEGHAVPAGPESAGYAPEGYDDRIATPDLTHEPMDGTGAGKYGAANHPHTPKARLKALEIVDTLGKFMDFRIISGTTEALMTARGVAFRMNLTAPFAVVDPGGATTEIALVERPELLKAGPAFPEPESGQAKGAFLPVTESYPVGAFTAGSPAQALEHGRHIGQRIVSWNQAAELWGVGGTMTTLAAMDLGLESYDSGAVNGHELTVQALRQLHEYVINAPEAELGARPIIGKRASALPVATSIALGIAEGRGGPILVADAGVRWGVAAALLGWKMP